nr:vegetative incompatibility protein het-e-1 [Quercus suber]
MAKASRYPESFVCFHGWFDDKTYIYLAMDFFPLGDLSLYIRQPLPEEQVRDIARQLLRGLQIIHNMGFTHRDLKPQNILVAREWPPVWDIRLGDFGIAKRVQVDDTELRTLVGTEPYMAPEMFPYLTDDLEDHSYSQAVDMWATGVLIFRMLTSRHPFGEEYSLSRFVRGKIDFPKQPLYLVGVSSAGIKLLKALLQRDAEKRLTCKDALTHEWSLGVTDASSRTTVASEHTSDHALTVDVVNSTSVLTSASAHSSSLAITLGTQDKQTDSTHHMTKELSFPRQERLIDIDPVTSEIKVESIALSLDGNLLAFAARYQEVKIWDMTNKRYEWKSYSSIWARGTFLWVAYNTFAMVVKYNIISLRSPLTRWTEVKELQGHTGAIISLAASSDGTLLASGAEDKTIRIWDPIKGVALQKIRDYPYRIMSIAFCLNQSIIISTSAKAIKIWDIVKGSRLRTYEGHNDEVLSITSAPDGHTIASVARYQDLQLWKAELNGEVWTLRGILPPRTSVVFSQDGRYLAWVSDKSTILLYNIREGAFTQRIHSSKVSQIVFSPDTRTMIVGSDSGLTIWEMQQVDSLFNPAHTSIQWEVKRQPGKSLRLFQKLAEPRELFHRLENKLNGYLN